MEYSFTDAPINNQPAAEPKKESKIKPIHILYIIGAIIIILVGVIVINTVISHMNEQQRIAEEQQQQIEQEEQQRHDAALAELNDINSQYEEAYGADAPKAKKTLFERTANEYIDNQENNIEYRVHVATVLSNYYDREDRHDEAIDLLERMMDKEDISNSSLIDCLIALADIYESMRDYNSEKEVLEQIMNLPEHNINGMQWEGGMKVVIESRLREISNQE